MMTYPRSKWRCDRVRKNNGMVEVFFVSVDSPDEEYHLMNRNIPLDRYEVGKHYWLTDPEPAFPHN